MKNFGWIAFAVTVVSGCAWCQAPDPCSAPAGRFCVDYYQGIELEGAPVLTRQENEIDYNWGSGSPDVAVPTNYFSARWHGRFLLTATRYRFKVLADDGVRVFLNGKVVIDAWRPQPATEYTGIVDVIPGEHLLEVEYFEQTGMAVLSLSWQEEDILVTNTLNAHSPLGTNIAELAYWSPEWTLLDAMKSAGGWYTSHDYAWDTREQEHLDLDPHGWPRSLPSVQETSVSYRYVTALLLNGTGGRYPAGDYIVRYDGEGVIEYGFDGQKDPARSAPGRDVVAVTNPGNGGILLRIKATDPNRTGNYLRNIRVIMPGGRCGNDPFSICDANEVCGLLENCQDFETVLDNQRFHPKFLNDLRKFKVIRFMDFLRTNTTEVAGWQERPQLSDARWNTKSGAPIEVALQMAVMLDADPWFNMPIRADDDYVAQFAQLALDQLGPDQRVYVEYGNEIWNTAFAAGAWVQDQAESQWAGKPESGYTKRINWYGKRAAEIVSIWKTVWGEEAERVIGVMGGFAASEWISEQALDCPLWAAENGNQPCWENMDALAIAPYFGGYLGQPRYENYLNGWLQQSQGGIDILFLELEQGGQLDASAPERGALAAARDFTARHRQLAEARGLELVAYEGGQHMAGVGQSQSNSGIVDLFVRANRDDRIGDLYSQYLQNWREAGGRLICHFLSVGAYGQWGSWGAKEYQEQENAPKYEALMDHMNENPLCHRPPVLVEQPNGIGVFPGRSALLTVVAEGAELVYQWRHLGQPIAGANSASLLLENVGESMLGSYDCLVSNPCGSVLSDPAMVRYASLFKNP